MLSLVFGCHEFPNHLLLVYFRMPLISAPIHRSESGRFVCEKKKILCIYIRNFGIEIEEYKGYNDSVDCSIQNPPLYMRSIMNRETEGTKNR